MYSIEAEDSCDDDIRKKCRKNKPLQDALASKINQIRTNPYAFKPLCAPLEGKRRVHVGPFVLIYKIFEKRKTVRLLGFSHHDDVY